MNANQHIKISTVGGALIAGIIDAYLQLNNQKHPIQKFDFNRFWKRIAVGAFGGLITSILPDLLEPATDYNHRKFFHSLTFAGLLIYGNYKMESSSLPSDQKKFINSLSIGYGLHLAADLTTPRSLPII